MVEMNDDIKNALEVIKSSKTHKIAEQVNQIKKALFDGANIDAQDKEGNTLLHHVIQSDTIRYYNTVEESEYQRFDTLLNVETLLRDYNPNPLIKNNKGLTPGMLAAKNKLVSDWQMLSSYETAYIANATANVLKKICAMNYDKCFFIGTNERNKAKRNIKLLQGRTYE